jgi:hypothetical protein
MFGIIKYDNSSSNVRKRGLEPQLPEPESGVLPIKLLPNIFILYENFIL